jgi:hypothetical protein
MSMRRRTTLLSQAELVAGSHASWIWAEHDEVTSATNG